MTETATAAQPAETDGPELLQILTDVELAVLGANNGAVVTPFLDSIAARELDPVMLEVRTRFIADFPIRCDLAASLVDGMADPATRKDSGESLTALAHRLAGLAGIIGFAGVSGAAAKLEELARSPELERFDPTAAHALVDAMRTSFAQELATPAAPAAATAPRSAGRRARRRRPPRPPRRARRR